MNVPISEYKIHSLCSAGMLRRQWRFGADLRRERIQLVHAYGFYPNVFCIPPARFAGCVTIASVRDIGAFSSHIKLRSLMQKTACRLADRVIANSKAVRDWLLGLGMNENQVITIPNGIVVPSQPKLSRDGWIRHEFKIPPEAPVIAVVARLNQHKGLEYFLRAAARVRTQFPEARFLVVGGSYYDPEYPKTLERLTTELGLNERVIFTGERNDIPRILPEVDISVLPSINEGLSNSLLEAMTAALPIVATRVGGNPEVVEDEKTGLLIPPRDTDALADAITRLLQSPDLRRQFGQAGFERVRNNFSLAATVRRTEDLYTSLLDEKSIRATA